MAHGSRSSTQSHSRSSSQSTNPSHRRGHHSRNSGPTTPVTSPQASGSEPNESHGPGAAADADVLSGSDSEDLSGSKNSASDGETELDEPATKKQKLRSDADKQKKKLKEIRNTPEMKKYRTFGRWIYRAYGLFIDIHDVFFIGRLVDPETEQDPHHLHLRWVYDQILGACPSLKREIRAIVKDATRMNNLIDTLRDGAGKARASDTNRLKVHGLTSKHFFSDPNKIFDPAISLPPNKAKLGFNHYDLARALIPVDKLSELTSKYSPILTDIKEGRCSITAKKNPAFLYPEDGFDPEDLDNGLLRGPLPIKMFRLMFTGLDSVDKEQPKRARKGCNVDVHGLKEVTPRTIAYTVVQTRYMLSSMDGWNRMDGAFDYEEFYNNIVDLFNTSNEVSCEWTRETLHWWNCQIFGEEYLRTSAPANDSESSKNQIMEQRRRKMQARAEALAQRSALAPVDQNANTVGQQNLNALEVDENASANVVAAAATSEGASTASESAESSLVA